MLKSIKQKVSIEAKFLNKNIKDHLLDKLKKTMIGRCSLEHGYFLNVNKLINVGSNTITYSNSLIIFDVVYEAETLKPELGQVITGTVCMVFQHGIFVDIKKMKVLVPATSMVSYVFKDNSFTTERGTYQHRVITTGLEVCIIINMIKYEQKEFSCIGELYKSDIVFTEKIYKEEVKNETNSSNVPPEHVTAPEHVKALRMSEESDSDLLSDVSDIRVHSDLENELSDSDMESDDEHVKVDDDEVDLESDSCIDEDF